MPAVRDTWKYVGSDTYIVRTYFSEHKWAWRVCSHALNSHDFVHKARSRKKGFSKFGGEVLDWPATSTPFQREPGLIALVAEWEPIPAGGLQNPLESLSQKKY